MIGLYVHVPFCERKCPYCDFYSVIGSTDLKQKYLQALLKELKEEADEKADTLYIGGGTPTLLSCEQIEEIVNTVKENYSLIEGEITIEANPNNLTKEKLKCIKKAGINRISIGMQSINDYELRQLKRTHVKEDIKRAVYSAKEAGINNISLDLMIGISQQTEKTLIETINFIKQQDINHISAYLLKIEKGTYYYKSKPILPTEDETVKLYLRAVKELEEIGLKQYEISNFAKKSNQSKHNLKYWNQEEYKGYGPAAHSYINKRRYAHGRDIEKYIKQGKNYITEIYHGGDKEEWLMLKSRLKSGVTYEELQKKGFNVEEIKKEINTIVDLNYIEGDDKRFNLTPKGMLIQNEILRKLIK